MNRRVFAYPYIVWMVILIVAPMILVFYYALTVTADGRTVFTLEQVLKAFDPTYLGVLARSVELALISTVICLLLGYPIAYILSRMPARRAAVFSVLFLVPMWMNFLLRTYAWLVLLDNNGLINKLLEAVGIGGVQFLYNPGAVVLGMVYNFLPFMVLPIYSVLAKMNGSYLEAAKDLGATPRQVFSKVIFPLSLPGVVSGITMVFVPAITTFAISRLLGGSQFMLYGDLIENNFIYVNDWHFGSALSIILMVLVLISMAVMRKFEGRDEEIRLW